MADYASLIRPTNLNGWWAASSWTSIFFEKPCAPWSGQQRKANPHPRHQSPFAFSRHSNNTPNSRAANSHKFEVMSH
jgi:hypothetical protein